jgi:hypothetical protein
VNDLNEGGLPPGMMPPMADAAGVSLILILSITAYGDAETKRKALENGAEALLTKWKNGRLARSGQSSYFGQRLGGLIWKRQTPLNQWRLGPALIGEDKLDPPLKSLFVYNSNPAIVVPEQDKSGRSSLKSVRCVPRGCASQTH